jgi:hypothetical protein
MDFTAMPTSPGGFKYLFVCQYAYWVDRSLFWVNRKSKTSYKRTFKRKHPQVWVTLAYPN